jgi:PAS domain S-box-containing protein
MVETGRYRLAWFGRAEDNEEKTVSPVAQYGYDKGYLSGLQITWGDLPSGQGPTGTALRTSKYCIARNIATDPQFEPWRAQAIERGFQSSIALPVCIEDRTYGVLNVYATEPDAFDQEESQLLASLVEDLAYVIKGREKLLDSMHFRDKLIESEERYKAVVDNLGIGVTLMTPAMEILAINKRMREWFPMIEAEKRPICYEAFNSPPREDICTYCPVIKTLDDGNVHEAWTETPAGDEVVNFRIVASPIKNQQGEIVAVIEMVEDITEAKRNEVLQQKLLRQLEEKNGELEEAYLTLKQTQSQILQQEKLASIGQLAAGVAHEINNPIGFVASNLDTLKKYVDRLVAVIAEQAEMLAALLTPEEQIQYEKKQSTRKLNHIVQDATDLIEESLEGTDRVSKIVQGLKTFSRIDAADYSHADINECLESTINIVWNELKYKAEVKKDFGALPMTMCFSNQLNQVFMNLLINAAHAITDFGEIVIKTWYSDNSINVEISDNGTGISEEIVSRIFEPFYTTKDVGKGTGLGLSISYDIVTEKHNGTILVNSVIGKGTTMTVRIPVVPEN